MKLTSKLNTIAPLYSGKVYGPALVSTREFGRWMAESFADIYPEFYLAATHIKNEEGFPNHPGAYLHSFFRKWPMADLEDSQRSFLIDSEFICECIKMGIVSLKDSNKLVGDKAGNYNYIKFYTMRQINIALSPLVRHFKPVEFTNLLGHTKHNHILCTQKPEWFYDRDLQNKAKSKRLFTESSLPPAIKFKTNPLTYLKGQAGIRQSRTGTLVNLYAINWDGRNWPYISLKVSVISSTKKILIIQEGSRDWHDVTLRKDGTFFVGGNISSFDHLKEFSSGKYPLEWVQSDSSYRITLTREIDQ